MDTNTRMGTQTVAVEATPLDAALTNVRASITMLDDEAYPVLAWDERVELIHLLRGAARELQRLQSGEGGAR
jgi:hypothetical protein